jgi:hypothetical protein
MQYNDEKNKQPNGKDDEKRTMHEEEEFDGNRRSYAVY